MLGRTISHYRVVEQLGKGGMGEVYRAEDTLLHRTAALKILRAARLGDPAHRERFLREARSASALNHPNIITIYDVISDGDLDCIVMECVQGKPLNECIPGSGMDPARAVELALQITGAVGAAHRAGIIHRDLKPANIMVTDEGQIKVLDFGIAKRERIDDRTPLAPLTMAGAVVGTLQYMSPEQALGQPVDARSDLFSLGAVFFEMLSGRRPFEHRNLLTLLHAVAYEEPTALRKLRPDLPSALEPIVRKALAKDPRERYQTAGELEAALESAALDHTLESESHLSEAETLLPSQPGADSRAGKSSKRLPARLPARGAVALAAFLVVLLGVAVTFPFRQNFENWLLRLAGSGSSSGSLTDTGSLTPLQLYQQGRRYLTLSYFDGNVDSAIDLLNKAISGNPSHAPSYAALSLAQQQVYDASGDPTWLTRAGNNAQRAMQLNPQLALAQVSLGNFHLRREEWESARTVFEQTIAVHPSDASAHLGLGNLYLRLNEYQDAETELKKAIALEPEIWQGYNLLSVVHYRQTRYQDALEVLLSAAKNFPDNPQRYANLMTVYHQLGDFARAAEAGQKMLEIQPSADGYTNLGTLYYFQGLFDQSLQAMKRAVELEPRSYQNWANLGDVYRVIAGHEDDARQTYQHAVQLIREQLSAEPTNQILRAKLAECLARSGQTEAALAEMPRVEELAGNNPYIWFYALLTYEIAGDRKKALEALEKALSLGYPPTEVQQEVELADLRRDLRYHEILMRREAAQKNQE